MDHLNLNPLLASSSSRTIDWSRLLTNNISEAESKYIQDLEDRRRRRNSEILAKIQELQLTAAVHAARSDRFQQLRAEYEALTRKYNYGGRSSAVYKSNSSNVYATPCLKTGIVPANIQSSQTQKVLVSTGCNTIITGPVMKVDDESAITNEFQAAIQDSSATTSTITEVNPLPPLNLESQPGPNMVTPTSSKIKPRPALADLSTTDSEDVTESSMNRATLSQAIAAITKMLDDTPDNSTTSFPVIFKQGTVNVFTDPDDSMSLQYNIPPRKLSFQKARTVTVEDEPPKPRVQAVAVASESPTTSIGDSLMDSIHNKTPESLPRDESSELLNIKEAQEAGVVSDGGDNGSKASTDEENDGSSKSEVEDEVSDLSNPSSRKGAAEEVAMTVGKADGEPSLNNEVIPTVEKTNVVFEQKEIGNWDESQSSDEEEDLKDAGTEKEKVEEIPVPSPVKVVSKPQPPANRRVKVQLGYSDSDGSDLSEIGATKPFTTTTVLPSTNTAVNIPAQAASTSKPPPKADMDDDFFDF